MSQTKTQSLVEAISNTSVGYVLSVGAGYFIYPAFGLDVNILENAGITLCFTVLAIARSYCMRRWFDYRDRERF